MVSCLKFVSWSVPPKNLSPEDYTEAQDEDDRRPINDL